jgi:mannose-6-phosphate isomerase-like protein (cupin superfamily)
MALSNYFHYVSRDHSKFFRFLGALAYTEATFSHTCNQISEMLRQVFGAEADTHYFDEHVHIDLHHGRMVFEKLVVPALAKFGNGVIEDIVRGIEEFRLLGEIAERDFIEQITWCDKGAEYKELAQPLHQRILNGAVKCRKETYIEPLNELSVTHTHDNDELCIIESGVMDFVTGHEFVVPLHPGEGTVLLHNRLHGAIITSKEDCVYHIFSIDDYRKCLS